MGGGWFPRRSLWMEAGVLGGHCGWKTGVLGRLLQGIGKNIWSGHCPLYPN